MKPNLQPFLLSFFEGSNQEALELNGFVLVKARDGNTGDEYVQVYTPESYAKRQSFLDARATQQELNGENL